MCNNREELWRTIAYWFALVGDELRACFGGLRFRNYRVAPRLNTESVRRRILNHLQKELSQYMQRLIGATQSRGNGVGGKGSNGKNAVGECCRCRWFDSFGES